MNYYQYKRRAPRSRTTDFIKPFLVIVIFVAILITGWKLLTSVLVDEGQVINNKVPLEIEIGSAKAMAAGAKKWENVSVNINLFEGEKLRTQSDGRVTLRFFDEDIIRLDESTEVELKALSEGSILNMADIELKDGKLWVIIDEGNEGDSVFTFDTGLMRLESDGGVFAITHPGMLYVLKGSVRIILEHEGRIVKSFTVGVGQELLVDEGIVADLAEGLDREIIFALGDAFKRSGWYRWNQQKEGATLEADDEALSDEKGEGESLSDDEENETEDDGESTSDEAVAKTEEVDSNDNEPPTQPQIEAPGNNDDSITLGSTIQDITGTVSADTEAVIVNGYRLGKYIPGSKKFRYTANIDFNNLEVGENEYEVVALDKASNKSETAVITLILPQEIYNEAREANEESASAETTADGEAPPERDEGPVEVPESNSSGGVKITSPNNGQNLETSETAFEIKGSVPEGVIKVLVNDYRLQGFSEGDTTFLYRASSTLGTLKIGELNTYTVKAYDADDKLLGTASMTIDVESSETGNGNPVITIPTSDGTYSTTLDQLVIGGSVGKWITRVKINGTNLNEYIPGSEEWKKTITLEPGDNSFEVCAEKAGEPEGCSSIVINYQN